MSRWVSKTKKIRAWDPLATARYREILLRSLNLLRLSTSSADFGIQSCESKKPQFFWSGSWTTKSLSWSRWGWAETQLGRSPLRRSPWWLEINTVFKVIEDYLLKSIWPEEYVITFFSCPSFSFSWGLSGGFGSELSCIPGSRSGQSNVEVRSTRLSLEILPFWPIGLHWIRWRPSNWYLLLESAAIWLFIWTQI